MNRTELKRLLKQFAAFKRDFRERIDYAAHMATKATDEEIRREWIRQYNDLYAQYQMAKHICEAAQNVQFQRWLAETGSKFFAPRKASA